MQLERLWLTDFRNYLAAELQLGPGLTVVLGPNGQGKTNLLEAIAWLGTLRSFRGAQTESMVRSGAHSAIVRAEGTREGRQLLIEAELNRQGRPRVQVNRQRLAKTADLLGVLRATVFTPDDLSLLKDGPSVRRRFLDETLVAIDPRRDAVVREVDRIIRQRNALLKQCRGRLDEAAAMTLDVWDSKLTEMGERLTTERAGLVEALSPLLTTAYEQLSGSVHDVALTLDAPWRAGGLGPALLTGRRADVARGVTLVGPHRDELDVRLSGLSARVCASQGEQRTLALALKLAGHRLVTERIGVAPLLLLDDVFSELDPQRCAALLENLPEGQALLTSADRLPQGSTPDAVFRVVDGNITTVNSSGWLGLGGLGLDGLGLGGFGDA